MKKILFILLGVLLPFISGQAETLTKWHGIDTVVLNGKLDVNAPKVYLYAHSTAERKNDKDIDKQDAAFKDLPNVMRSQVKNAFPKAQVVVVSDPSQASSDGLLIDACLTKIDWGDAAVRTVVGLGAGGMWGYFDVKVSDSNGVILQMSNRRYRSTALTSAKGAAVIKAYNKELARDFVDTIKNLKDEGKL